MSIRNPTLQTLAVTVLLATHTILAPYETAIEPESKTNTSRHARKTLGPKTAQSSVGAALHSVEMPARGKPGKPKAGFPSFPLSLEIAQRFPHSHIFDDCYTLK